MSPKIATAARLPFQEAIEFLRRKTSIPTERWTDIWQAQHAAAFVVAGAVKDALLADLRQSVQSALDNGETLEDFRKSFDEAVAKHGWAHTGGRNWRSRVIFETNLRTAYAAGRYEQLQEAKKLRPFWEYRHGGSKKPRAEHLAWDGLILRADDPWWETHYPPNGWGCSCKVFAVGERELRKRGIDPEKLTDGKCVRIGADGKGTLGAIPFKGETYEWISKDGTRRETLPRGVQPGWAYNVGKAGAAEKQREENVRQEMESQSPIPPGLSRDKRDALVRAHLRSRAAAEKKAGAVITANKEKTRATGLIREVARKIPLTQLGFKPGEPPPDVRNIPEAAIDILNERLRRDGMPFEILKRPEKDRRSQSGARIDALSTRVLKSDDARRLALPETASVGSVHLAQTLRDGDFCRARGTSICEEELARRTAQAIAAGNAVELIGSDGINYYRVGRNVFGATLKPGGGIDFFPVSGPDIVFLGGDRNKEAAEFIAKVIKRNGSPLSETELERWALSSKFTSQELAFLQRIIGGG